MRDVTLFDAPGVQTRRRHRLWSVLFVLALVVAVVPAVAKLVSTGFFEGERWKVLLDSDLQQSLLTGLGATIKAAVVSIVLSLVVGLLLAVGSMSHRRWLQRSVRVWVETFRGLPELLIIFFVYLGVPVLFDVSISTFWALVIGLVLYESASMCEALRAGFLALPKGQSEAAHALGLRQMKTLRFVLLPQVVVQVLPSLVSEMVRVTKASSLGFVIGYTDVLLKGQMAIEFLGDKYAFPVFAAIAAMFVVICLLLSTLSQSLTKRLH